MVNKKGRRPAGRSRSGCLIWLIPLALGMIVLAANPKVMRDLASLLAGGGSTNAAPETNKKAPPSGHEAATNKAGGDRIGTLPDTRELQAIISGDMREHEKRTLAGLDDRVRQGRATNERPDTLAVRVYFICYDGARDQLYLKALPRNVRRGDSPALAALEALFAGPTKAELEAGYRTLIPAKTRINRLHVENGVLIVDLSREFVYNQTLGQEGLVLQIYQVVNSMTDFPTVTAVRFLIDGRSMATAGGDGVPFGRPFRHNDRPLAR